MARYEITGADGAKYEVTAPDNMSEADVLAEFTAQTQPKQPQAAAPKNKHESLLQRMAAESSFTDIAFGASQIPGAVLQMAGRGAEGVANFAGVGADKAKAFREWVEEKTGVGCETTPRNSTLATRPARPLGAGSGRLSQPPR